LNLGNPAARNWLVAHVDKLIEDQGVDLYRQDFNMAPLEHWRAADPSNRRGITEIRHVEGYLAYYDELRKRRPGMLLDTCSSGGKRNDLETLRRAIPLWRTDYSGVPVADQCCTYGISFWIPLYGQGAFQDDAYSFRSNMVPFVNCLFDVRKKTLDYNLLRRLASQWREIADCYLGDYYPLTKYSATGDSWMAWQFDRPETGRGFVQAFRRGDCILDVAKLRLRGLDPDAVYTLVNLDGAGAMEMLGRDLLDDGLPVAIRDQPGAVVIKYFRVPPLRRKSTPR
jgi:alpha-galactosidase